MANGFLSKLARGSNPPANTSGDAQQIAKNPAIDQELGVTNVMPATSWANWTGSASAPTGQFVVGRDPLAPKLDELVFMLRRDGQARAMLNLLTLPIRAAFASSEWVSPEEGGGEEETAFANLMWSLPANAGGMQVPSSLFLRQTLLALAHGFSAFEVVRQVPETGPLKGMITLKKMAYRDPRTIYFLADEKGSYTGFRQIANFANRSINVIIPEQDSWYYAANEEENPMYGVSMFEPAFQHYQAKRKLYYIGELAAQLAAVPGRIGEIPPGATPNQILEFKQALANFAFNTAMVNRPGFKVDSFNGNSNFDFLAIIDHHNMMMASSILAKFLQQEDRQVLIDNGKADASADMFVQMLEAITNELSESWTNKIMPQFIDYNFGTGIYPKHKFAPLTDANKEAIMQLFTTVVAQPVLNCTPEFVRTTEMKLAERLGYDIDYEKVAEEEAQQAAEQQAQQEAMMQQQAQQQGQQGQQAPATPGTVQPRNLDGTPAPPAGAGTQPPPQRKAPTGPPSAGPVVRASFTEQQEAVNNIANALSVLFNENDVPDEYAPEGETLPETGV